MGFIALHMSILGLSLLGFVVAFYIAMKKYTKAPLICPMKSDCNTVIQSHHSEFLGMRVEYLGMAYYLFVALMHAIFVVFPVLFSPFAQFVSFTTAAIAALFSLYLISIQGLVIKQWCVWCLTSAFVSGAIIFLTHTSIVMPLPKLFGMFTKLVTVLHLFGVTIGVGAATITDIFFFRFLKDYKISEEEASLLKILSNVIWAALGILLLTGVLLFLPKSETLLASGKFLTKMTAIAVLIANGFLLNIVIQPRLARISFNEEHDHMPGELHHIRKLSFALGAISLSSWYFIFVLGALRGVVIPYIPLVASYGGILIVAVVGSQIFDRYFIRKKIF